MMRDRIRNAFAAAVFAGLSMAGVAKADFIDTFDGPGVDPAWVTDRYEPNSFTANGTLNIGISNAQADGNRGAQNGVFYNTQGRQRAANVSAPWILSADLLITSAMLNTTSSDALIRTDLWGADVGPANYPIFGFTNESLTAADRFNAGAADRSARFRFYDSQGSGDGWTNIAVPVNVGWNNLAIKYDGSSFTYLLNGVAVATDLTAPGSGTLQTAFVQAYNFGHQAYSVQWDNVSAAAVPLPVAALGGFALMGVVGVGRRRRANA